MLYMSKRDFKKGQKLYVVNYCETSKGTQASETSAEIVGVCTEKGTFLAVLYGNTYQKYSFEDYGRLFFDKKSEAEKAANELPKPTSTIYQIMGNKTYKKTVAGIKAEYIDGSIDLVVCFDRGKNISIKEIGVSLFLNESEVRKNKK